MGIGLTVNLTKESWHVHHWRDHHFFRDTSIVPDKHSDLRVTSCVLGWAAAEHGIGDLQAFVSGNRDFLACPREVEIEREVLARKRFRNWESSVVSANGYAISASQLTRYRMG